MKTILVTGALGQIGTELVGKLREIYGVEKVIASSREGQQGHPLFDEGIFEILDVTHGDEVHRVAKKYKVDTIIHLAALLSATAENDPLLAWRINMDGLLNTLEVARELQCKFFTPSSIGAFGPSSPKLKTPQVTIQRPTTMYGVNKVAGELLCDYYFQRFGVDTRGLRFPGLISYLQAPGGGTTDYAVHIYHEALSQKEYTCYLKAGTYLDMMYMPDAIQAIIDLMEANGEKLKNRNAYNVTGMSIDPEEVAASIRKHIPQFVINYQVDPLRQAIADSWPDSIDPAAAIEEWGFKAAFDLDRMTADMLNQLNKK